jgi:hypothetical protein
MEQTRVSDYEQLLSTLTQRYFQEERRFWAFRGQSKTSYVLIPKVGRVAHTSRSRARFEQSVFNFFKRQAYPYLAQLPASEWEWLTLAQHYGLPTRLLDWTYNPLIALYFAVETNINSDGAVYALRAPKRLPDWKVETVSPFEIDKVYKFIPVHVTKRLIVQEGLFTVHPEVEVPLQDVLRTRWKIESLVIPSDLKETLRYILYRQGIHRASLFPDLDGLASHLQWQHSVSPDDLDMDGD